MPSVYTTDVYDIHYLYEAGYDDAPKLWAHKMFKDEDGNWNSITEEITDRYDFTDEDIEWLLTSLKQSDGTPYTELSEFYVDEFYDSKNPELYNQLPPNARHWLHNLLEYEYTDSEETN